MKTTKPGNKKDWEIIEKVIKIPYSLKTDELNVYVWNTTGETAYFDDLKIEKLTNKQNADFKMPALYLYIDEPDMQKLRDIRNKAFKKGILETNDDSWVKASMFYKNEDYKIKLRFKGDWLDHLEGNKWSFRIKIKKGKAWKGLKTFSIQNPESRHFLDEWFAHKILKKEDVLTTRYDFVPVYLNNNPLGIYAFEEHFEKQLPESQKRREGVILKFSEDQFWATYREFGNTDFMPVFEAADIIPFKFNKTLKNTTLKNQFLIAQNILYEYKYNIKKASEIFDIKKVAKFYAIITLAKMNHSLRWHNMRFYYNPVISKLEPVAYDGYTTDGYMAWGGNIFGNFEIKEAENTKIENRPNYFIFTDSVFRKEYLKELEKISSDTFLNNIFTKNKEQIKFYENELQKEFPFYVYDTAFLYDNAKKIRQDLNIFKTRIKEGKYDTLIFKTNDKKRYTNKYNEKSVPYFINVFTENTTDGTKQLKIENCLPYPVNITGFAVTDLFVSEEITPVKLDKYETKNLKAKNTEIKYLCVKVPGKNKIFFIDIFPFRSPVASTPLQKLSAKNKYNEPGKIITFKKGNHIIDKTIIIPAGKKVIFEAGANIDIINKAAFISYSPVFIKGTAKQKVIIQSSDFSANGFTVLQAEKKSEFKNAVFKNLNTLNYEGWNLTGAVTLYESDVYIDNCKFENNRCEDALNIVRSVFNVKNCSFENIFSDAFDSDFCTGTLENTNFDNIGNDAVDFSGSSALIKHCNVKNAGDKGISGGENSEITVDNCAVNNAKIGFASKDKSDLNISNCEIINCKYGFTVFQKKPEYGPAKISANNIIFSNTLKEHLIEKKSLLILNGKNITGYDKNTAKKFY
ncbi:MAG: hypothetical protein GXO50_06745 [Chlorobi bacterium]|nr:hypothetical protein [Chlorobiota bacterium]